MFTIFSHNLWILCIVLLSWTLQCAPALSQTAADGVRALPAGPEAGVVAEDGLKVIPVAFPGAFAPRVFGNVAPGAAVPVPVCLPGPVPVIVPTTKPIMPQPNAQQPQREKLMITEMNGEVHFKHLQGPRIDPARALYIETGKGTSWCECKMQDCTGRIWSDSQVSVFPDAGVYYLEKGALVVKAKRDTEARYTVISGDFMCRVQGTTLRVQRNDRVVNFQVLDGTVTVYNRKTGELFKAGQVTQPVH